MLYVTGLEAAGMLRSGERVDTEQIKQGTCPFLRDKLCGIRDHRALGCRIYYCDPSYQETGNRITEQYLQELKCLADERGLAWSYAPLHHFLNHPEETSAVTEHSPGR